MAYLNPIIDNVCKMGLGAKCCKYLTIDGDGWECAKTNPELKAIIDRKWSTEQHVAQGDNCEGHTREELNAK